MPKLRGKKILAPEKQILAFPDHYVTLPGKIAIADLKSSAKADDYDADTDPYVNVAVLVHGFVRKDRLVGADKLKSELIHVVNA